jgi:hypothetical protein
LVEAGLYSRQHAQQHDKYCSEEKIRDHGARVKGEVPRCSAVA